MMLRAISEIAVAIRVRSLPENPTSTANSRPLWRAVTMSASRSTDTRVSSATVAALPHLDLEQLEPFLEIERGIDPAERQAELDHRHRDLRLDADDDGPCAAQLGRLGNAPKRSRRERIHDVERSDVDDDPA